MWKLWRPISKRGSNTIERVTPFRQDGLRIAQGLLGTIGGAGCSLRLCAGNLNFKLNLLGIQVPVMFGKMGTHMHGPSDTRIFRPPAFFLQSYFWSRFRGFEENWLSESCDNNGRLLICYLDFIILIRIWNPAAARSSLASLPPPWVAEIWRWNWRSSLVTYFVMWSR